jgi:hypothetical protein
MDFTTIKESISSSVGSSYLLTIGATSNRFLFDFLKLDQIWPATSRQKPPEFDAKFAR